MQSKVFENSSKNRYPVTMYSGGRRSILASQGELGGAFGSIQELDPKPETAEVKPFNIR